MIASLGGLQAVMEESAVGESESNGKIERSIRTLQGQVGTIREDLESRLDDKGIPVDSYMALAIQMGCTVYQSIPDRSARTYPI